MNPRDLTTAPWMTSAIEQLEAARPWTANLRSLEDNAAKITGLNAKGSAAAVDAAAIYDSIPDASQMITGAIPNAASIISGSIPDVSGMVTGTIPDASTAIQGFVPTGTAAVQGLIPDTMKAITGLIPDASSVAHGYVGKATPVEGYIGKVTSSVKIPGDFTSVTSGLALEDVQRAGSAFAALGALGGAPAPSPSLPDDGLIEAFTQVGQAPVVPRGRKRATVIPKSLRESAPLAYESVEGEIVERKTQPPQVLPQELGEELAQDLARQHRQEVKGLLVALSLDLGLEHLETIERRLRDGGRPDRLHAALSAGLLLEEVANQLFPPRNDEERWTCRFGNNHKLGAQHVKNRLHAFAHPFLKSRSTAEHKLFVAELDLASRWSGEGHHVVFTPRENAEAFIALLKVLATVARAYRRAP